MPRQPMRQVVAASLSGAALEWYDFNLYGISAGLIFGKLFFPNVAPIFGTLAALATFGAGFVLRPLGALLFGHYGDRLGRKRMLVATMLIIGGATVLIGVLPDYRSVGVWAPILLVTLRLVQGLGLGGEQAGAALLTVEHAPPDRRGFWGSLPQTGGPIGYLIAVAVTSLFALLPDQQFMNWGWRIPFLFSAVLLVVGLLVRRTIQETPDFRQIRETGERERMPLVAAVRKYPRTLLIAFGARIGEAGSSQIFQPFAISYLTTTLGYGKGIALTGVLLYNVVGLLLIPVAGALSDRIGRKPIYVVGAALVTLSAFPYFWLLDSHSVGLAWTATSLASIGSAVCMSGVQGTLFTEMFGAGVRYSALGIATQASALLAGFVPAIATSLVVAADGSWPVALLLAGVGLVSLVSSMVMSETRVTRREVAVL
ncbi:MHS family MFS transporter [Amycolatopsis acidicola]|uniref:Putative proline/betaine transporter n=1 Tax=Amycolatopsis acidicola TaxID=2596893 RepID=A0A5N0US48_9PSEU|nr:MFS transporter [Amycolatopsis acidicola]KAA9154590.1 MHS family MFS transporter [Amycolatopsis acidicola]